MKLIVGLGNPGTEYASTRHNAGFLAIDALAAELDARWTEDAKRYAMIVKTVVEDTAVMLIKPQTYMNASGEAIRALTSYYKIDPKDILIVQDELDLAPGRMAFLEKGSSAGHNGIASIHEQLGTTEIARLRIGIGRAAPPMATEHWVLGKIDPLTIDTTKRAPQAIRDWITKGMALAMNIWNQTKSA